MFLVLEEKELADEKIKNVIDSLVFILVLCPPCVYHHMHCHHDNHNQTLSGYSHPSEFDDSQIKTSTIEAS